MKNTCIEIAVHSEKLYRTFLDIIKIELESLSILDINSMQALILINIGHNTLTIGELTSKGYYSGSNSSYNVRKMTIGGYISHQPSEHDKRACYITLSEKGKNLYNKLMKNLERYMHIFSQDDGKSDILRGCAENLKKITTAWKENLEH